jgi:Protein of unknown function (DUF1700)
VSTRTDGSVERYLRDLDRALRDLPGARRREIVEEIRGHIEEGRAQGDVQSDADIHELLDRLGEPEDIAADARERFGIRQVKVGALEVIALIMLPIGALILPVVGWFVGVVCLWVSPLWTTRDKLIGTLVVPGGMLLPIGLGLVGVFGAVRGCGASASSDGRTVTSCSGPNGVVTALITVGIVAAFVLPVVVDVYLYRRLRRSSAPPSEGTAGRIG